MMPEVLLLVPLCHAKAVPFKLFVSGQKQLMAAPEHQSLYRRQQSRSLQAAGGLEEARGAFSSSQQTGRGKLKRIKQSWRGFRSALFPCEDTCEGGASPLSVCESLTCGGGGGVAAVGDDRAARTNERS